MNNEQKRKQIQKWAKIAGFLGVTLILGPLSFTIIQGLAGLVALVAVWTIGNALVPVLAIKLANWRLKAIKDEAAKNPIETLEREHLLRKRMLEDFETALRRSIGSVDSFGGKLSKTKKEHPGSPEIADLEKNYGSMVQLVNRKKEILKKGREGILKSGKELDRMRDIWELILDAREMNKSVGGDAESEFMSKLQTDVAFNSVQREMHMVFADIEVSLLEEAPVKQVEGSSTSIPLIKEAVAVVMILCSVAVQAQPTNTFISGTLDIRFNSRTPAGGTDVYLLNVNVANSVGFTGTITNTPIAFRLGFVSQQASLTHDINCEVINPKNPAQRRPIGRIYGTVPISAEGAYDYSAGTLGISGGDQNSKFTGQAQGKPLVKKKEGLFAKASKEASAIYRMVGGKASALIVTNYDNMVFNQTVLAGGPLMKYPQVTVNGELKYDYDRLMWFFNNVQLGYYDAGRGVGDRLTGQISYDKKKNEYVFDVRLNEPPVNESNAFTTVSAKDEASFFETDASVPGLRGTMKYRDTGDPVTSSNVKIDLVGTQLTQAQTMNLFKLIILACIVPMNNE